MKLVSYNPSNNKILGEIEENTKDVTNATEIDMLMLMKESGVSEKQIREVARKKKIPMKTVNGILGSDETKKAIHA